VYLESGGVAYTQYNTNKHTHTQKIVTYTAISTQIRTQGDTHASEFERARELREFERESSREREPNKRAQSADTEFTSSRADSGLHREISTEISAQDTSRGFERCPESSRFQQETEHHILVRNEDGAFGLEEVLRFGEPFITHAFKGTKTNT
jgi:hypothetical protein